MTAESGRALEPRLVAKLERDGERLRLLSPTVGAWRSGPPKGALLRPGFTLGHIDVLGVLHRVVAPPGTAGVVVADDQSLVSPTVVQYGSCLATLDINAAASAGVDAAQAASDQGADGLAFRSPLSGRFYLRPSPDQPPFVKAGDTIKEGQTVALLEVMKTFNRITYGGDGLPPTATVLEVVPANEDDVEQDEVLLRLGPA